MTPPNGVAYSPNGRLVAIGGNGGVQILNVSTGAVTNLPTTASYGINSVAFSPNGETLAVCGVGFGRGVVELWNVSTGTLKAQLNTTITGSGSAVAFSPDGKMLADGGTNLNLNTQVSSGVLELWNLSSGALISSLPTAATEVVHAVVFSPNSKYLVAGGIGASSFNGEESGALEIWTIASQSSKQFGLSNFSDVRSVCFSPDGKEVAAGGVGSVSGALSLFAVSTGAPTPLRPQAATTVNSVAISPDGKVLAYGGYTTLNGTTGVVKLWNPTNGALLKSLPTSSSTVTSVAFSPAGTTLAVLGITGESASLEIWNVATGKLTITFKSAANSSSPATITFSPNGKLIAVAGQTALSSGVLEMWDLASGLATSLPTAANTGVQSVAFSPDGTTMVDGGTSNANLGFGILETWNVASLSLIKEFTTANSAVLSVAFSADGKTIADGGYARVGAVFSPILEIWDLPGNSRIAKITNSSPSDGFTKVAFTLDGKTLLAGSCYDLEAFSTSSYNSTGFYPVGTVIGLAVSANGSQLAYCTQDGDLVVGPNPFASSVKIAAVTLSEGAVVGGNTLTGSVRLSAPAPADGVLVQLASSNSIARIPDIVTVPAGATSVHFEITTSGVDSASNATITAGFGSGAQSSTLTVQPAQLASVTMSSLTVTGGTLATGTVSLIGVAGPSGIRVGVSSSSSAILLNGSVTVGPGQNSATFLVVITGVSKKQVAPITATLGSISKTVNITITP